MWKRTAVYGGLVMWERNWRPGEGRQPGNWERAGRNQQGSSGSSLKEMAGT